MRIEFRQTTALLGALAIVTTGLFPSPVVAEEETTERFRANAISTGGARGRSGSSSLDLNIERWSSDEERAQLLEVVQQNEPAAMIRTLQGLDRVGTARLRNSLSYDFQYSREIVQGDMRQIILVTDRPIAMEEARRNTRSMDSNLSIIQLQLDADGNGEGTLMVGAELVWNEETDTLEVTHFSSQPVRLTNVRRRN